MQALDARHRVLNQRLRLDKARRRTQQLEQGGHQAQQHTAAKLAAAQLTQKILALQAGSLAKALEVAVVGCSDAIDIFKKGPPAGKEVN